MKSVGSMPLNGFSTSEPLQPGDCVPDSSCQSATPGFESFLEPRSSDRPQRPGKQPATHGTAQTASDQSVSPEDIGEMPSVENADPSLNAQITVSVARPPQAPLPPALGVFETVPDAVNLSVFGELQPPVAAPAASEPEPSSLQPPSNPTRSVGEPSPAEMDWIAAAMGMPQCQPRPDLVQPNAALPSPDGLPPSLIPTETPPASATVKPGQAPILSGKTVPQSQAAAIFAGKLVEVEQPTNIPEIAPEKTAVSKHVPSADGMSVAMQHPSMPPMRIQPSKSEPVALAEAPSQPQPAIAEIAWSVMPVSPDQETNMGDDTQNFSDNSSAFDPVALITTPHQSTPTTPSGVRSETIQETGAALLNPISEAMERMRSNGQNNVEIRVQLHDGQEVTIQLKMSTGEFQPIFKTESPELRAALEQNWNQFTSHSADRGLRIAAPVFETPQSGLGDFQQRHDRPQQQESPLIATEEPRRPAQTKPRIAAPIAGSTETPGSLALFA